MKTLSELALPGVLHRPDDEELDLRRGHEETELALEHASGSASIEAAYQHRSPSRKRQHTGL